MTFSIAARTADGTTYGVAVASKFLAVGSAVPAAAADVGALATQAEANLAYARTGMRLLARARRAGERSQRWSRTDEGRDHRQVGVVDATAARRRTPAPAAWPGPAASTGDGYAIQGNILTGPEVVEAMEAAWLATAADEPLVRRLLAALTAGDRAGGDSPRSAVARRCTSSRDGGGLRRRERRPRRPARRRPPGPGAELARLLDIHDLSSTADPADCRSPGTGAEVLRRLESVGHTGDTVARDSSRGPGSRTSRSASARARIDPRVLAHLRATRR